MPRTQAILPSGHLSVSHAALILKGMHFHITVIKAWVQFYVLIFSFTVISQYFLCDYTVLIIVILVA